MIFATYADHPGRLGSIMASLPFVDAVSPELLLTLAPGIPDPPSPDGWTVRVLRGEDGNRPADTGFSNAAEAAGGRGRGHWLWFESDRLPAGDWPARLLDELVLSGMSILSASMAPVTVRAGGIDYGTSMPDGPAVLMPCSIINHLQPVHRRIPETWRRSFVWAFGPGVCSPSGVLADAFALTGEFDSITEKPRTQRRRK